MSLNSLMSHGLAITRHDEGLRHPARERFVDQVESDQSDRSRRGPRRRFGAAIVGVGERIQGAPRPDPAGDLNLATHGRT